MKRALPALALLAAALIYPLLTNGCSAPPVLAPGSVAAPTPASTGRARIAGAWQLESRTVQDASGAAIDDPVLGKQPLGRLFYDASGRMAIQMMRMDRKEPISAPADPAQAKNPRVILGYDAYFGTFDVDDAAGTVTHHVEGSLFPEDLGESWTRNFTLDGDTFTLKFTSDLADGPVRTRTLVFTRAK